MILSFISFICLLFAHSTIGSPLSFYQTNLNDSPQVLHQLNKGNSIRVNDKLISPNNGSSLFLQNDGNICIYKTNDPKPTWCNYETVSRAIHYLGFRDDGVLCAQGPQLGTDGYFSVWCLNHGQPAEFAQLTDDGKLQLMGSIMTVP